jgi:hypothetical protein
MNTYIFYAHNFDKNSGGSSVFFLFCDYLKKNGYNNFYIAPLFCRGDGIIDRNFIKIKNLQECNFEFDIHGRTIYPIENLSDDYFNKENYNWPDEYKIFLVSREILNRKNNVAIYSEGMLGNPLQQKYCIRWILYFPTPGLPVCPYFPWGKKDKFIFWTKSYFKNKDEFYRGLNDGLMRKTDYYPQEDDILYLQYLFIHKNIDLDTKKYINNNRNGSCYLIRKADINYNRTFGKNWNDGDFFSPNHPFMKPKPPVFIHPSDSVCIDSYGLDDLINIFKEKEYFYCYDLYTFHNCIALLYGCKVIMCIPEGELTKEDWHCGDECYLDYVSWGNSKEELKKSEEALKRINYGDIINKIQNNFLNEFNNVYSELDEYFNNIKNNTTSKIIENLECCGNNFSEIKKEEIYNDKDYTQKYSSNFWEIEIDFIIHPDNKPYANLFDCNFNIINYGPRLEYNDNTLALIIGNHGFHKGIIISNNVKENTNYNLKLKLESNSLEINFNNNLTKHNIFILSNSFDYLVLGKGFNNERYFKGIINKFIVTIN